MEFDQERPPIDSATELPRVSHYISGSTQYRPPCHIPNSQLSFVVDTYFHAILYVLYTSGLEMYRCASTEMRLGDVSLCAYKQ